MIIMIFGGFFSQRSADSPRILAKVFGGFVNLYMCTFLKLLCKLLMYEYSISEFSWVSMGLFGVGFGLFGVGFVIHFCGVVGYRGF